MQVWKGEVSGGIFQGGLEMQRERLRDWPRLNEVQEKNFRLARSQLVHVWLKCISGSLLFYSENDDIEDVAGYSRG